MYKNILVPTDGSKLAAKGVKEAVKLASALGAKVTGVYVVPPYRTPVYSEGIAYRVAGPAQYKEESLKEAKKTLAAVEIEAQTAGVPFSTRTVTADGPTRASCARRRPRSAT